MTEEKCVSTPKQDVASRWSKVIGRRKFLHGVGGVAAAGAAMSGKRLFADSSGLSKGDAALLQFAAAAEFIEADLWAQPAPVRLVLRTDLDLETGDVRVTEASSAGG